MNGWRFLAAALAIAALVTGVIEPARAAVTNPLTPESAREVAWGLYRASLTASRARVTLASGTFEGDAVRFHDDRLQLVSDKWMSSEGRSGYSPQGPEFDVLDILRFELSGARPSKSPNPAMGPYGSGDTNGRWEAVETDAVLVGILGASAATSHTAVEFCQNYFGYWGHGLAYGLAGVVGIGIVMYASRPIWSPHRWKTVYPDPQHAK